VAAPSPLGRVGLGEDASQSLVEDPGQLPGQVTLYVSTLCAERTSAPGRRRRTPLDARGERLGAVDDAEHTRLEVEAPGHEIGHEGADDGLVLRVAEPEPAGILVPSVGMTRATTTPEPATSSPSIMTTATSRSEGFLAMSSGNAHNSYLLLDGSPLLVWVVLVDARFPTSWQVSGRDYRLTSTMFGTSSGEAAVR
jgi:hypothetical protein